MNLKKKLHAARTLVFERCLPYLGIAAPEGRKCVNAIKKWLAYLESQRIPSCYGRRTLLFACGSKHWVEWAAFAACHLRLRGIACDIIYDPAEIASLYPQKFFKDNFWHQVSFIPDVRLYPIEASESHHYADEVASYAPAALSYELRIEEADIIAQPLRYANRLDSLRSLMSARVGFLVSHLRQGHRYVSAICYSGLIAETFVYRKVFSDHKIRSFFTEGWGWRPGNLVFNENGPALDYQVTNWWRKRGPWTSDHAEAIDAYIGFMDSGARQKGFTGMVRIQNSDINQLPGRIRSFLSDGSPYVIVAPNVIGDTSTVRRETIFPSIKAWINELILWASENPSVKLVIRAHPAEVWMGEKCTTRIADFINASHPSLPPNVLVIASDEKANTFAISSGAKAALVWMSTAGADFTLRRIPCIAAAKGGYSGLGVLLEPETREDYFDRLNDAVLGRLSVHDNSVQLAREYMHLLHFVLPYPVSGAGFRAFGMDMDSVCKDPKANEFFDTISRGSLFNALQDIE